MSEINDKKRCGLPFRAIDGEEVVCPNNHRFTIAENGNVLRRMVWSKQHQVWVIDPTDYADTDKCPYRG